MGPCILFYRGSGLAARVIRWWTKSPFAHCAPCIDGRVYDAFWTSGVTVRPLAASDAVRAVCVPLSDVGAAQWSKWLSDQAGKPYDKGAIIAAGLCKRLPGPWHVYDSAQGCWTCSRLSCLVAGRESVAWGLRWPITPGDLYEILTAEKR